MISVVEVIDLDPKINNVSKKNSQLNQVAEQTANPISNSDLGIIINSRRELPKI